VGQDTSILFSYRNKFISKINLDKDYFVSILRFMKVNLNKDEYCYTNCQVGCNKQTKHKFINTDDKTRITLACCECVLKQQKGVTK